MLPICRLQRPVHSLRACRQENAERLAAAERIETMGDHLRANGSVQAWLANADPGVAEARASCLLTRFAAKL